MLLNEGEDAYKPEVYGNRIIVERRIPRSGSPSFKIMVREPSASWVWLLTGNFTILLGMTAEKDDDSGAFSMEKDNLLVQATTKTSKTK